MLALSLIDKRSKYLVLVFASLRVLISGLDTLGVILIGILLSKSATEIFSGAGGKSTNLFEFSNFFNSLSLPYLAIFALLLFVLKSFLSAVFAKSMADVLASAETKVASNTYEKLLYGEFKHISNTSSQDLIFSLNSSATSAISGVLNMSVSILSESTLLLAIGLMFVFVDGSIALAIALYFSLIGYLIYKIIGPKMQELGTKYSYSALQSSTSLNDSVIAFREIFTLRKHSEFSTKFSKGRLSFARANAYATFYGYLPRFIVESALLLGAVLLAGYVFRGNNTANAFGIIGVFLTGSMRMMSSLVPLQNSFNSLRQLVGLSEPFFRLIEITQFSKPQYKDSKKRSLDAPVFVEFKNVTYKYPDSENPAINNVSFKINPGELVAIIGPSGSGKSTIADLLIKLINPDTGEVNYGDKDFEEVQIGYVPQSPGIISGTILDNITLNVESKFFDSDRLSSALQQSHLESLVSSLKNGINTDLGAQSDALSGGQIQRIGLARALYANPNLLVLDEATSALDAETESAITESLNKLKGKCSIIIIAHRLSTVQDADCVIVVENGSVVASGKFNELVKTNELVSRYVELSKLNID